MFLSFWVVVAVCFRFLVYDRPLCVAALPLLAPSSFFDLYEPIQHMADGRIRDFKHKARGCRGVHGARL